MWLGLKYNCCFLKLLDSVFSGVSAQSFLHCFTLTSSAFNLQVATPGVSKNGQLLWFQSETNWYLNWQENYTKLFWRGVLFALQIKGLFFNSVFLILNWMHASYSIVLSVPPTKSGGRTIRTASVGKMENFGFLRAKVSQNSIWLSFKKRSRCLCSDPNHSLWTMFFLGEVHWFCGCEREQHALDTGLSYEILCEPCQVGVDWW